MALTGDEAARLRPRFGALGWAVGRARLRRDEVIEIVRLAPTASMILVPTDRGRLGIAPASEEHLLSALAAAARIQQRLDEVAERARAFMDLPTVAEAAAVADSPRAAPAAAGRPPDADRDRTAAAGGAAGGRARGRAASEPRPSGTAAIRAAEAAAAMPAAEVAPLAAAGDRPSGSSCARRLSAWLALRRAATPTAGDVADAADGLDVAATAAVLDAVDVTPASEPIPCRRPCRIQGHPDRRTDPGRDSYRRSPSRSRSPKRPGGQSGRAGGGARHCGRPDAPGAFATTSCSPSDLALTPVIGAGVIWLIAYLRGDLGLSIEELRPIALALLAVGPAGALAALAARAWYPRLQGLVTITALTALVLVGRVLLG